MPPGPGPNSDEEVTATQQSDNKQTTAEVPATSASAATVGLVVGRPVWQMDGKETRTEKLKKDARGGWICPGVPGRSCGFINFAFRDTCKQCEARKLQPSERATKRKKVSTAPISEQQPAGVNDEVEPNKQEQSGSGAWAGTNLAGAAEANAALLARYHDDPTSLNAEDRARAEALLARSQRKGEAKAARKAAKGHARALWGGGSLAGIGKGGGAGGSKGGSKGGGKGGGRGGGKGSGNGGGKGRGGGRGDGSGGSGAGGMVLSSARGPAPPRA
jgi:hypothetical protein